MRQTLPSGDVTFLFTDVEASTALLGQLGVGYADALAEHRRVLRAAVRGCGGVEVDTQGDACFFAFGSPEAAVTAAVEAQSALAEGPVRVRMGIHRGSPTVTPDGYVGLDVHLGARIGAVAHGGQIVMSHEVAQRALVPVRDLGEHRLKDFERPAWLFQVGQTEFPPLRTLGTTNLPTPASPLVGRGVEVAEITELLRHGHRFLTLTGPGGIGKTRLAIEAASEVLPDFLHGVYWVPFEPIRDPVLVEETIARAVGAHGDLALHFRQKRALLVLDNLEHLTAAAPAVAQLVERTQQLAVIVTSRELLRVRDEHEYVVPPLAEREAVALFCERTGLEESDDVHKICLGVDRLPLAVEIIAARARLLTPAQILEQLWQRLDFEARRRDAPTRQQTLRETIRWSFDLLTPNERMQLARLSVFRGGCTLNAAAEVCRASAETIESLLEKSLIQRRDDADQRRFSMLETIRQFSAEELDASGTRAELERRLGDYLNRLLHDQTEAVWEDAATRRRLTCEHANLVAAIESSHEAGDDERFLSLVSGCCDLWVILGHVQLGRKWVATALAAAPSDALRARLLMFSATFAYQDRDLAPAIAEAEVAVELARALGDTRTEALAANQLANALNELGDAERALVVYRDTERLARTANDHRGEAIALVNIASILNARGSFVDAHETANAAVDLFRIRQNSPGVAAALLAAAHASIGQGDTSTARSALREAAPFFFNTQNPQWIARCLDCIAAVSVLDDEPVLAAEQLAAASTVRETMGIVPTAADRALIERARHHVGRTLQPTELSAAQRRGQSEPLDMIVERALSTLA